MGQTRKSATALKPLIRPIAEGSNRAGRSKGHSASTYGKGCFRVRSLIARVQPLDVFDDHFP